MTNTKEEERWPHPAPECPDAIAVASCNFNFDMDVLMFTIFTLSHIKIYLSINLSYMHV